MRDVDTIGIRILRVFEIYEFGMDYVIDIQVRTIMGMNFMNRYGDGYRYLTSYETRPIAKPDCEKGRTNKG